MDPFSKMLTLEKQLCIKAFLFLSLKLEWDCPALAKLSWGLFCVHFLFFSQLSTPKQTIKRALSLSWNVGEARVELFRACYWALGEALVIAS